MFKSKGMQLGEFRDITATGKRFSSPSITISHIANGRIAERWNLFDRYGMLQQLGVLSSR